MPPATAVPRAVERRRQRQQPALPCEQGQTERDARSQCPGPPIAAAPEQGGGAGEQREVRVVGGAGIGREQRHRAGDEQRPGPERVRVAAPPLPGVVRHQDAAQHQEHRDEHSHRSDVGAVGERERCGVRQRGQRGLAIEDAAVEGAAGANDQTLHADGGLVGVEQASGERGQA